MPVAIEQVGSIILKVGLADLDGTELTTTFNAGLVHPVVLFVMVILYDVPASKLLNTPVLFVLE